MACKYSHASIISSLKHQAITPHRNHYGHINMSMYSWYSIQNIRHKTLIKFTGRDATAKRGAHFHPTVGSATPNGFTTSHPWAETVSLYLPVTKSEGCNPSSLLSLTLRNARVPLASTLLIASAIRLILSRGCVWHDYPRTDQAWRLYRWAIHHPIPHQAIHLPACKALNFRSSELLLVLRASGVQIRY